ncbi:MAG: bacillithiol biosynthesis cysteine-adding enzyme BshC [Meiothermus sp.]|uniref:bacillithiol biosynthesis cysteine-adding enzyme BshC n=1 Tax=Meiothermus sp. TaxID=1955249 RepID=UPI0025E86400|nr:bacillithiol biosynthesis cysteine-adding enzyme BshC [Meiothermus sp.]MCS7059004.1 bacillithiol biosynthesis cysteine-adding enzyme BshC [Meiothermus sp.]MCS7194981.1 bacillithiol biosynthesis cysteine-adding enzyme BshC [Meiothermus sp.]MDW8091112.1 bacillithiol biosynthesis cysteine-adding enzyme BshC [Meiothermus sp.]MDW8482622.1 bacillithiol biosynthesis cysteine-adding enzyme BshC [Meiothermus sp.]
MADPLRLFLPYGLEELPVALSSPKEAPREALSQGLQAYLRRLGAPEESLAAARHLAHPQSRAIVTGQQAGLLTGPAYTFYKAHTALRLAAQHHHPDRPVVPVFWVASQDHDTSEVSSVELLDFEERIHRLTLNLPPARPAGRIPFAPHLELVCGLLGKFGGRPEVRARLCQAMLGPWSYSEVFARMLLEFLGPQGLVVFDPMAPELAPLFVPALERELANPLASSEAINRTARAMKQAGLEPSLGRGESATNLFLEGDDGLRRLLRFRDGRFDDGVQTYTLTDLRAILAQDPARLTPAAGLRPVLQDTVLPTAGFVVGPSELRYVAELGEVYALHGLTPPAVISRMRTTVIEPPIARILKKYNLDPWAFQEDPEGAFKRALAEQEERIAAIERHLERIQGELEGIQALLPEPTLARPKKRAQARIAHELERLKRKILDSALRQENTIGAHFARLQRHLAPNAPQERAYPFPMYLIKHGEAALRKLTTLPATGQHIIPL